MFSPHVTLIWQKTRSNKVAAGLCQNYDPNDIFQISEKKTCKRLDRVSEREIKLALRQREDKFLSC